MLIQLFRLPVPLEYNGELLKNEGSGEGRVFVSSDPRNPHNWSLKVTNITESDLKVDSVHVNVLYIPPKEEEWFYSQWGYFLDEKIGD